MTRTFEDKPATREKVPLLVGLFGPSGSGKTYSALRLATGIQRVNGGEIFVIDTEARRALHYADRFKFRHLQFGQPFGPLDYLAAIEHCASKGASVIVIDSMSHEHEGPGGVLEMHERELDRLAGDVEWKRNAQNFAAWAKPKSERQRLINTMLQFPCSFVLCFRAKEKIKVISKAEKEAAKQRGEQAEAVRPLGFMPIGDPTFVFEMMLSCLLLPGAGGVPTWDSIETGEKQMTKLPGQFRHLFGESKPLDESLGEEMAKWAAGAMSPIFEEVQKNIVNAMSLAELEALTARLTEIKESKQIPPHEFLILRSSYAEKQKALKGGKTSKAEPKAASESRGDDPEAY